MDPKEIPIVVVGTVSCVKIIRNIAGLGLVESKYAMDCFFDLLGRSSYEEKYLHSEEELQRLIKLAIAIRDGQVHIIYSSLHIETKLTLDLLNSL